MKTRTAYLLLSGVVFVVYVSASVPTLHRYGITQDEPEHWDIGKRYLQFYLTFNSKLLDFSSIAREPAETWPVGPTLSAVTAKLVSGHLKLLDWNEGHHLASLLLLGLLLSSLFLFLAIHVGPTTALLSVLALALQPRIWGDAHNNSRDIPHLVFYAVTILSFLHGMLTRKAAWILISAVLWGLALGSKFNAISIPVVIAPMIVSMLRTPSEQRASTRWSLVAYPFLAFGVLFLAWPYFWQNPLSRLSDFRFFLVQWGYAGPMAWQVSPARDVLVTTPVPTLLFALLGIGSSAWSGSPLGRPAMATVLL